jgi:hypothetical protein
MNYDWDMAINGCLQLMLFHSLISLQSPGSEDVYDKMLTQAEVQGNIAMANEIVRKRNLDSAGKFNSLNQGFNCFPKYDTVDISNFFYTLQLWKSMQLLRVET